MNYTAKPILKDNFYAKLENCTFENDKIGRESIAQNLTDILKAFDTSNGLILAIDSAWGGGKTTFIKMWKNMLDSKFKIPNFYFSAWEDDHTKEPLIAIFSELNDYLKSTKIDKGKLDSFIEITDKIFAKTLPNISKAIAIKMLENVGINDKLLQNIVESFTQNTTISLLESYTQEKEIINQLKEVLIEILGSKKIGVGNEKPFIIFIDELDRTRPTYAIEMLETIKHLFGIANLVFVISIDKAQLSKSIQAVYGNIDTQNYLRRFFDLEFILPKSTKGFLTYLNKTYNLQTIKMEDIVKTDNFSLRELEHFASQIRLLELFNKDNKFNIIHASFILFVKMQDESLYKQIPNITDVESLTHLAEKLVCNGKTPLDENIFRNYIKIIYGICDNKIYNKDNHIFLYKDNFSIHQGNKRLMENSYNKNIAEYVPDNTYSYIIHTYYDFLRMAPTNDFGIYISIKEILEAIDFVTQFK